MASAAATLPALFAASLVPCWRGNLSLPTTASVRPLKDGAPSAPPAATTSCAATTIQNAWNGSSSRVPATIRLHAMPSISRGRPSRSTRDPAGPAHTAPTREPTAITVPIWPGFQCRTCANQVDRKAPSPPPTSAIRKLIVGRASWAFMLC